MEDAVGHAEHSAVGQAQKMCGVNISRKARQEGEQEQRGIEGWAG